MSDCVQGIEPCECKEKGHRFRRLVKEEREKSEISGRDLRKPFWEFKTINSCWWLKAKSPVVDIHGWILSQLSQWSWDWDFERGHPRISLPTYLIAFSARIAELASSPISSSFCTAVSARAMEDSSPINSRMWGEATSVCRMPIWPGASPSMAKQDQSKWQY